MIDPHVHLRDWNQKHKETVAHGLSVAYRAGLDAVFEMPNTNPPLTARTIIEDRIALADGAGGAVFHGLYAGLTSYPGQAAEMAAVWRDLFPRVVGLKLYAGSSTGDLAVTNEDDQRNVITTIVRAGYDGVLAVHCEKESLFRPEKANIADPFTHTLIRPPASEVESVRDMIGFAERTGFRGNLHICHISTDDSVREVEKARKRGRIRITCGITPHHAFLCDEHMKSEYGFLLRVNPPLRPREVQKKMLRLLLEGKIDWIETDHAPHTREEKRTVSGIPGLPFYPHCIRRLKRMGMTDDLLKKITHDAVTSVFNIPVEDSGRIPDMSLRGEYEFDPFDRV
ncbi:MAG: dihydroorotase [Spirochaetales bacterium]|nr:dihydroorotase [Spirochaetales bacterium]